MDKLKDVLAEYVAYWLIATFEAAFLGVFTHLALPQWGYLQEMGAWWLVVYVLYRLAEEFRR